MPRPKLRKGFTLVELLVVIAIISILAAILFPAFGRVRENGRRTACASNLRQINLAVMQYVQDNDEILPAYRRGLPASPIFVPAQVNSYVKSRDIWKCISSEWKDDVWDGTPEDFGVSYGLNAQIGDLDSATKSLAGIAKPTETVAFCECAFGFSGSAVVEPNRPDPMGRPFARHNGLINVSFVDGHVKAMRHVDLEKKDTTEDGQPLTGEAASVLWNGF